MGKLRKVMGVLFAFVLAAVVYVDVDAKDLSIKEVVMSSIAKPELGADVQKTVDIYFGKYGDFNNPSTDISKATSDISLINGGGHTLNLVWQIKNADGEWENYTAETFGKGEYRLTFDKYTDKWGMKTWTYVIDENTKIVFASHTESDCVSVTTGWHKYTCVKELNASDFKSLISNNLWKAGKLADFNKTVYQTVNKLNFIVDKPVSETAPDMYATVTSDVEGATVNEIAVVWYEYDKDTKKWVPMTTDVFKAEMWYGYKVEDVNKAIKTDEYYVLGRWATVRYNDTAQFFGNPAYTMQVPYSYAFLEGSNLVAGTQGKFENLTWKVDAPLKDFGYITINNVMLEKDVDFTVEEGCTLITLTEAGMAKVNALAAGDYDVKVQFRKAAGEEVEETLTVSKLTVLEPQKEAEPEKETEAEIVVKPEVEVKNPETGDNVVLYVGASILSLAVIGGAGYYFSKRKFN